MNLVTMIHVEEYPYGSGLGCIMQVLQMPHFLQIPNSYPRENGKELTPKTINLRDLSSRLAVSVMLNLYKLGSTKPYPRISL